MGSSLVCSGGCCQPCITIIEYITVVVGVILAILLPAFAIIACIAILGIVLYVIRIKCLKKKEETETETKNYVNNDGKRTLEWEKDGRKDVEDQGTSQSPAPKEDPKQVPFAEASVLEEGPFDVVPLSDPPKYG